MVMQLPVPPVCSLQLVDDIVAERQGGKNAGFFSGIAQNWRRRVQAYIDAEGSPEVIKNWPDIAHKKTSFLSLYVSPAQGSVQGNMLAEMRRHGLSICPACGEAGAPNTLDHYLPKSQFPHFCVTPHNLFPMCDACQTEKGDKTTDVGKARLFLHPYFDVFVAEQVLELAINPPFDAPTFELEAVATLSAPQRTLVERHTRELAIVPRYAHFFRGQHQRLLRMVQLAREKNGDVEEHLIMFRELAGTPTRNAWDHVFYSSVLSNAAMLDYLINADLPAFR